MGSVGLAGSAAFALLVLACAFGGLYRIPLVPKALRRRLGARIIGVALLGVNPRHNGHLDTARMLASYVQRRRAAETVQGGNPSNIYVCAYKCILSYYLK